MPLNIKDPETEALVAELAALTGQSKTATVRAALREQRDRLMVEAGGPRPGGRLARALEYEVWPSLPPAARGGVTTKTEREAILGYGPSGV